MLLQIPAASEVGFLNIRIYRRFHRLPGSALLLYLCWIRNPDITPTITMIAMISVFSVLANLVTSPPILFAIPVSNSAWPTTNMPTQRITLLFTYCENVVDTSTTPVSVNPIAQIEAVSPSGIFSRMKLMIVNTRNNSVIVCLRHFLISFHSVISFFILLFAFVLLIVFFLLKV